MGSKSREAAARLTDMDTGHSGASVATVTDAEADLLELGDPLLTEQDNGEDEGESEEASPDDATPTELSDEPVEEETPVDDNAPEETDPSIEEGLAEDALLAAGGGGHHGPPTAIITGSSNVFINGLPAARQGDMLAPHHPGTRTITEGSGSVLINGMPAARVTDAVDCGGTIATGSSNVFIGDNPVLVAPSDASLPDIEFDHHRTRKPRSTNNTASQSEVSSQVDSVSYNPSDHAHTNDTHVRVEPVASNLGSVTWVGDSAAGDPASWGETYGDTLKTMLDDTIQTQADLANQTRGWGNVMQPLFKPIAGLGAAVGNTVGLLEGLSPKGLSPQVKNYWADQLSGIQQVAKLIGNAAQGDPAAAAQLTPAILTGAAFKKLTPGNAETPSKAKTHYNNTKFVNPQSFAEARARLEQSRQTLAQRGSIQDKYSQTELAKLAATGDINDKYIVRIMKAEHLNGRDGTALGGYLGQNKGGKVKYWSTTFDQIEADDTDPRAIAQRVGIDYQAGDDYVMVLVDREKAMAQEGSYAMLPNYDNMNAFAKQELSEVLPYPELLDETLTPATSEAFLRDYQAMAPMAKDGAWDVKVQKDYFGATNMTGHEQKIFKNRLKLYNETGANEHYLGNGLTKNLNDTTGLKPQTSRPLWE